MIFSSEKWENGRELQQVIKGSSAMEWMVFAPVLTDGFELFIRPLLGEAMMVKLIECYKNVSDLVLIKLAQRANANLAIWYSFNELNTILSSSGTQRNDGESFKSLYKYQERSLREGYKTKGFNALDDLLSYLEEHETEFPEYKQSKEYKDRELSIVRTAEEVNRYLPIESSRLVYLRFLPHMLFIEKTKLVSFVGEALFKKVKDEKTQKELDTLRELLQPVIINLAAARLIRQSGSITDRGLYFSSVVAGISGNDETSVPADPALIESQAKLFEQDAKEYMSIADRYIKNTYPDLHKGSPANELNVDNNGRMIFWA